MQIRLQKIFALRYICFCLAGLVSATSIMAVPDIWHRPISTLRPENVVDMQPALQRVTEGIPARPDSALPNAEPLRLFQSQHAVIGQEISQNAPTDVAEEKNMQKRKPSESSTLVRVQRIASSSTETRLYGAIKYLHSAGINDESGASVGGVFRQS